MSNIFTTVCWIKQLKSFSVLLSREMVWGVAARDEMLKTSREKDEGLIVSTRELWKLTNETTHEFAFLILYFLAYFDNYIFIMYKSLFQCKDLIAKEKR